MNNGVTDEEKREAAPPSDKEEEVEVLDNAESIEVDAVVDSMQSEMPRASSLRSPKNLVTKTSPLPQQLQAIVEVDASPPTDERPDHFRKIVMQRRASDRYIYDTMLHKKASRVVDEEVSPSLCEYELSEETKEELNKNMGFLKEVDKHTAKFSELFPNAGKDATVEIRLENFSYKVKVDPDTQKIRTVYNQSNAYTIYTWMKRKYHGLPKPEANITELVVLDRINLTLKPGKMYLILGPPASGKTSLLKTIAGRLPATGIIEGNVYYNGASFGERRDLFVSNAISYVEQLDFHAPRFTVDDTFDFAFQCRSGGTHLPPSYNKEKHNLSQEAKEFIAKTDKEKRRVHMNTLALGLDNVADTFVGDSTVRGVSGGQRRRVTVGEMMQSLTPVLCGDEISTGLDAASTFDIVSILSHMTRVQKQTRVISLLQPSPETAALFDEIILLADGMIIYAGPTATVEDYFGNLGYRVGDQMDVADFLQVLSTPDGKKMYHSLLDQNLPNRPNGKTTPYTNTELADAFRQSPLHSATVSSHKAPWDISWASGRDQTIARVQTKYANSFGKQVWLNLVRNMTLWRRDTRFLIANAIKNLIMGVSVGGVFFQTESSVSIFGVSFQIMLFIMLGAMVSAPGAVDDRIIYYKQADSNFYSAFPYVIGKALALAPQALMDVMIFGTIIYWMVGFTAAASNFFIFIAILFVFSLSMNQMLSILAAIARTKTVVQALSAIILLFLVLFCGFIINPNVIPVYYIWIYWWNPLAWAYRAVLVNEFLSPDYDEIVGNITMGQSILISAGFTESNGNAFGTEWIGYSFAYSVPYTLLCLIFTGLALMFVRVHSEKGPTVQPVMDNDESDESHEIEVAKREVVLLPFQPVNLTFQDVCYDVDASKGKEKLRLLHDVSGVFASGRMCALMGSSGAGKTTLMDVIALRKNQGTVSGDIRLNGFPQNEKSFRRCSGYVEQFDVQAPELTVKETVLFSARLRLDSEEPMVATDEDKVKYVDHVLETLELEALADCLVGSDEEGGLSFEQRKRLSIAVELAASPSIIFLDEPTSGLDARAALLVCKALRLIANTGRTVIATIHQPSSAVFELFDDLLLLKKGGGTVFFGDLGDGGSHLIKYFESKGAQLIDRGENPANWMLKVITDENSKVDYAKSFVSSQEHGGMLERIAKLKEDPKSEEEIKYEQLFAAPADTRRGLMRHRLQTIYWRSPAYSLSRITISAGLAFILGSVFLSNRSPPDFSETQMSSLLSTIFISFIIIGVLSITSVLPVMLKIRDSFYRHQASGMLEYTSLALGLGVAEQWFIILSGAVFTMVFIATAGLHLGDIGKDIGFWAFFTYNIAIYSYFGQAFMCSVKSSATAQILASVFIGLNNFFSGLIVRPQYLTGFFEVPYWITPGHYVYEGLVMTLFYDDERTVYANTGSEYNDYLISEEVCKEGDPCAGTVVLYVDYFFGGRFQRSHILMDALILTGYLIIARLATLAALKYFKYTST